MQAENALLLATTVRLEECEAELEQCKAELEQIKQVTAELTPRAEFDANEQVLYLQYPNRFIYAPGHNEIVNFVISKDKLSFDGFELPFLKNQLEFVIDEYSAHACTLMIADENTALFEIDFSTHEGRRFTLQVQSFSPEARSYYLTHNAVFTRVQHDRVKEAFYKAWRAFGAAVQ